VEGAVRRPTELRVLKALGVEARRTLAQLSIRLPEVVLLHGGDVLPDGQSHVHERDYAIFVVVQPIVEFLDLLWFLDKAPTEHQL
jgi:hypothetical protein